MISATAFTLILVQGILATEKIIINVDVYYGASDKNARDFITTQLMPVYPSLQDHLHLNFVPYGNATHEFNRQAREWSFECKHGENECKDNKEHACVFDAINWTEKSEDRQRLSVEFLGCVMSNDAPSDAGPNCTKSVGLEKLTKRRIDDCTDVSMLGDVLLSKNGDKTNNLILSGPVSFLPAIIVNGLIPEKNQEMARQNFATLICDLIPRSQKPDACKNKSDRTKFYA